MSGEAMRRLSESEQARCDIQVIENAAGLDPKDREAHPIDTENGVPCYVKRSADPSKVDLFTLGTGRLVAEAVDPSVLSLPVDRSDIKWGWVQ